MTELRRLYITGKYLSTGKNTLSIPEPQKKKKKTLFFVHLVLLFQIELLRFIHFILLHSSQKEEIFHPLV